MVRHVASIPVASCLVSSFGFGSSILTSMLGWICDNRRKKAHSSVFFFQHLLVFSHFRNLWYENLYQTVIFSGEPHWNRDLFNRFLKIYCLMFIVHVNVIAMSKLKTPARCLVSSFFILHHVVCRHPPRSSIASLLHLSKQYFEYPIIMICKPLRILCTNCNY